MTDSRTVPSPDRNIRPHQLTLRLGTDLGAVSRGTEDDFGWEVWGGAVTALWWVGEDAVSGVDLDTLARTSGWGGAALDWEAAGEAVALDVGRVELWLLRLGEDHPAFADVPVADTAHAVFEAADAVSDELQDTVYPVLGLGRRDGNLVSRGVQQAIGSWFNQLLVLRSVEVARGFRGTGVGAWAAARAVCTLARDDATLVVAKAAPLRHEEFLSDPESRRALTGSEARAWTRAQRKISAHWQETLGLVPVPGHREVLVGNGGVNTQRRATLARWAQRSG